MKSEDGTGSRRPLLGDAGMSPRLFHSTVSMSSYIIATHFLLKGDL